MYDAGCCGSDFDGRLLQHRDMEIVVFAFVNVKKRSVWLSRLGNGTLLPAEESFIKQKHVIYG